MRKNQVHANSLCLYEPISVCLFFTAICPHLCSPWHGNINMTLGNLAGSKVTYSCDHDYSLIGPEERTCMDDGTWDYDDPHCEPVGKLTMKSGWVIDNLQL